ncbi:TonB-dependent receptor plug domain-containing protein [Chitinimonas koreensis]|uniref:TonB-dependent receptor plug domain-containing protein n=1 Tax=Chitinimonas koreensis TaxID=356302 RepID=UPI0003F507CF|nr:TonB-dependent receptor [Chitinimonas koreensis]QNM98241.1 TonB-dependent receptor [Chitinimonas koreensis]
MPRTTLKRLPVLLFLLGGSWALAASGEEEDLELVYGDKSFVSIATGSNIAVSRAPAVATVITAEEIASGGFANLDDVLETVPGMHVGRNELSYEALYIVRGIISKRNPEVLMLLNGQPMTSPFVGNRGDFWQGMPLEHVARIEVIRGPGSALYGADAYSGVINIITKDAKQIDGNHVGTRLGSFGSRAGWFQHGGKWGDVDVAAYLNVERTDGSDARVEADGQTFLDGLFGSHASHAPGPVNRDFRALDAHLELAWNGWRLRTAHLRRDDIGSGAGIGAALDPDGSTDTRTTLANLGYQTRLADWELSTQADYYGRSAVSRLKVYPNGAFGGAYPDGFIGNPSKWERRHALSGTAVYSGWQDHRLRFGVGVERTEIYKTAESKNFEFVGGVPVPTGGVVDVSGTDKVYLKPHVRRLDYVYLQDEWSMAKDWTLTAGIRHDRYSDFGNTTNPRLALVWEAAYNVTAKLLYGQAFRAPSFVEQYIINNPVTQGNPNAKPEKISTGEFVLNWQPQTNLQFGLNVFRYQRSDILRYVPVAVGNMAENTGGASGRGFELEAAWEPSRAVRLSANFAHQRSVDDTDGRDAGIAPHNHAYARADWRFDSEWSLSGQFNWVAGRHREAADVRTEPVPDYHTVDATLRRGLASSQWEVSLTARNLFDADAREPSFAPGTDLPQDIPLAGRSWLLQARYQF